MTEMKPKSFYDDIDNEQEIKKALEKNRFKRPFKYMYEHFFKTNRKYVTTKMLQNAVCLPFHSYAHQILLSLSVLNLLERHKQDGRKEVFFLPKNRHWWDKFYKVTEDES